MCQKCRRAKWEVKGKRQVLAPSKSCERENVINPGHMPLIDEDRSSKIVDLTLSLKGGHTKANLMTNQATRGSPVMKGSSPQNIAGQYSINDAYPSDQRQAYNGFIEFL